MREMPRIPPEEARERAERAAEVLAADPRVKLVFLFGSAADPHRKLPVRDVDLAIWTEPTLDLRERLRLRDEAVDAAGGEIDLVPLNEAGVILAHEVAETGRCLYADPPERETDFVCRAVMRYLDFKYYHSEHWRLAGERLEERLRGLAETSL
jgi:predicted nucleotidyltransferase